ncbi:STAS domain-containing protein [Sansalvadorimonas sp. 2012CJ34-2]|uniref:Anti-sigma factor antagonist n=1 Tax=Parendozoicomonas callyspongiae TaxID=2942213 RepID=A0ABT0PDU5_9GAMM|nr:STAS domain-containing protein [Sansalvadorimonas sp. 2012CJ34-2]MCL6268942.1 STAS domain-containing protein [Sansalvadorimonas sp. 2012CJ34-2]
MALELVLEEYHELAVVILEGCVRASNAGFLQNTFNMLLSEGHARIVLDCRALSSMNSDGLAVLSDLVRATSAGGGKIVLCHASKNLVDLLDISGLDQFIEVTSGRAEAMRQVMH